MMKACRWVKEAHVIEEYVPNLGLLDRFQADYVMHADDVINDENGENIYTPFIRLNKYK